MLTQDQHDVGHAFAPLALAPDELVTPVAPAIPSPLRSTRKGWWWPRRRSVARDAGELHIRLELRPHAVHEVVQLLDSPALINCIRRIPTIGPLARLPNIDDCCRATLLPQQFLD